VRFSIPRFGRPIDGVLREPLAGVFGDRVAQVRLHRGPIARVLAAWLGADAFVLGCRIFLSTPASRRIEARLPGSLSLLAHEIAHAEQYVRHGTFGFLARYAAEYLRGRLAGQAHREAYRSISFERAAEKAARPFRRV
jgi:hypothetical protein